MHWVRDSPWTESMEARMGLASWKVRVGLAKNTCNKARWLLLYGAAGSSSDIVVGN